MLERDWQAFLPRRRRPVRALGDLVDAGKATVHVLQPGGVVLVAGVDFDDPESVRLFLRIKDQFVPEVMWVFLPHQLSVDALSPSMVRALVTQATVDDQDGHPAVVDDLADQPITTRCPRCNGSIQVSITIVTTDGADGLTSRATVDPVDVDLHSLSCTGR